MAAVTTVGAFNLLDINVGLAGAIGFLNPLCAQIDLMLGAQFGLGSFALDLELQFNAVLNASLDIGLSISNPFLNISLAISAAAQLAAALEAAISLGLPTISLELNAQLSACASLAAALGVKLGGLKLLLELALAIKIPALSLAAELAAALSLGPIFLQAFEGKLQDVGTELGSPTGLYTSTGLHHGGADIDPTDDIFGIALITKAPGAKATFGAIFKIS